MQEALVRAWNGRRSCRDQAAPLPWILQITRNEARRIHSRTRRRGEVALEEHPLEELVDAGSDATLDRAAVQSALADLPLEDRTLVEMRYASDLTYARLADLLGLAEGTVKVRLHRLRRRLHGALQGGE